jgi:hypothetical protein
VTLVKSSSSERDSCFAFIPVIPVIPLMTFILHCRYKNHKNLKNHKNHKNHETTLNIRNQIEHSTFSPLFRLSKSSHQSIP